MQKHFLSSLILGCLLLLISGCDYLPKVSSYNLSNEQTEQLVESLAPADEAIISLFDQHQIVAIGDAHFYDGIMVFITQLVASEAFAAKVRHIVVEFGNANQQELLDAYLAGEAISEQEIQKVWRDTLFFTAWTPVVYQEFFRAVREFNAGQTSESQLKVTLAEQSFDWRNVTSAEQWQIPADNKVAGFSKRFNERVQDENVLLIFGAFHTINLAEKFVGENQLDNLPLITQINAKYPNQVYSIWPVIQESLMQLLDTQTTIKQPSFIALDKSALGTHRFADLMPKARIKLSEFGARNASTSELFDGMLFVPNLTRNLSFPDRVLDDEQWLGEMQQRVDIIGGRIKAKFDDILAISIKAQDTEAQ